jgi:hypothetical protein
VQRTCSGVAAGERARSSWVMGEDWADGRGFFFCVNLDR